MLFVCRGVRDALVVQVCVLCVLFVCRCVRDDQVVQFLKLCRWVWVWCGVVWRV